MIKYLPFLTFCTTLVVASPLFSQELEENPVTTISLEEAIAGALKRNFTVQIEQLAPQIARQNLRNAKGLFDPTLEAGYSYSNREYGSSIIDEESSNINFGVRTKLPWGTDLYLGLDSSDYITPFGSLTGTLTDEVSSFVGVSLTQPLLRGFGPASANARVYVAKENLTISNAAFRETVMSVVRDVIRAYQNVYFAQKNLEIAVRNRDLASQLLKDNEKRVETGIMAPLDRIQAESEAALRDVSVISARSYLRQSKNALRNLIFSDPSSVLESEISISEMSDPDFTKPDLKSDYRTALELRPDYTQALAYAKVSRIELAEAKRNFLPQLDVVASYGSRGTADSFNNSIDRSFHNGQEAYSIGAVVSIPFPNRSRSAEKATAYLRRNRAELTVAQTQQLIRIELDDAITQLSADWERIRAARRARELAQQSLQAEEKKLQAGTSSTFIVLRLQGDLAAAEIREVNALTDYVVSKAEYRRVKGTILQDYHISLQD